LKEVGVQVTLELRKQMGVVVVVHFLFPGEGVGDLVSSRVVWVHHQVGELVTVLILILTGVVVRAWNCQVLMAVLSLEVRAWNCQVLMVCLPLEGVEEGQSLVLCQVV